MGCVRSIGGGLEVWRGLSMGTRVSRASSGRFRWLMQTSRPVFGKHRHN